MCEWILVLHRDFSSLYRKAGEAFSCHYSVYKSFWQVIKSVRLPRDSATAISESFPSTSSPDNFQI